MSKRDFLKKCASLVGGATLLGGAVAQGGNVNADLYKDMLNESWSYFFARMFLFARLFPTWKGSIEKKTKEKAFEQLKYGLTEMILKNFDTVGSSSQGEPYLQKNFSIGGKDGFFIKTQPLEEGSFDLKIFNKNSSNKERTELLSVKVSADNLSKVQEFYDTIDYMVTASKLEKLCKNRPDLFQKSGFNGTGYNPKGAVDLSVNGKKVKRIYPPSNVNETKDGFLGGTTIAFEDDKFLFYDKRMKDSLPLPKMTKCLKEIIEQVERNSASGDDMKDQANKYLDLGDNKY